MKKLYYGGDILTMEKQNDRVEAILIENGKILKVGQLEDFKEYIDDSTIDKVNLDNKTMMPGFIDAHSHISMAGTMSIVANLRECKDFDDIINTLKSYITQYELSESAVVIGFGYDHNFLKEESHPTKDVLNKVSLKNPVFISHISGHMGCANDIALQLAGINESTVDEEDGYIGRVKGTNEPNGYLEEASMMKVNQIMFSKLDIDYINLAMKGQEIYIQNGITTAQDGATSSGILKLFTGLAENNQLKIDIVTYPTVAENPNDMWKDTKYAKKYYNRLKIGGYKLFLDGSPQGKTAWLTEPYEGEEEYRGYPWYKDNQVKDYILKAINDDVQLLTHCNGDAASDQLLDNYNLALQESNNTNKNKLRPVMIHCQTVRNDQLDKMVELDMIPSIFNAHTYYWGDVHLRNLGETRGNKISPAKSAFDKGLIVNFHQDTPVVEPDMLHTVWSAVNRITKKGVCIGEEECVNVYDALKAITINAAYAYFEEKEKGSIKEGKIADFVILDQNPLKVDKMDIKTIKVLETIKEGETIYTKRASEVF